MSNVGPDPADREYLERTILTADRADQLAPRPAPKSPREAIVPTEVPPPPPPKKNRSRTARSSTLGFLSGFTTFVTLILLGLGAAVYLGREEFNDPGPLAETKLVAIPQRASLADISEILAKAGVISSEFMFTWGTRLTNQADRLKAGEYEFRPGMSMREVAETLADGKVVQHSITFPEGWTSEQIVARIQDDPILTGKVTSVPEEGTLMPDTYKFERGRTRDSLIQQMKVVQEKRLAEIWAKRVDGLPLANPREMVILASIVEKETSKADERPRVAAVFINRLRKGMRLETDPTILYGLYGGKAWLESRTITRADLNAPNPYNTYKISGLPPGPIGNPGRAAMEAVANPSRTNELFFVADGTGGHAFAETLEEHNRNVQRWRVIEASRRGGAPAPEAEALIQGGGGAAPARPAAQPATPRPAGAAAPATAPAPAPRPAGTAQPAPAPRPAAGPATPPPSAPRPAAATPPAAAPARPAAAASAPPPPPPPPPAAAGGTTRVN